MATPEITWEWDDCELCGSPATHRQYWGEELLHQYCEEHYHAVANAIDLFWLDVADAAGKESADVDTA